MTFDRLYSGACVDDAAGRPYLEIRVRPEPGDMRTNNIDFGAVLFSPGFLGLHVLDYNFAIGDLMSLVQTKADAMP